MNFLKAALILFFLFCGLEAGYADTPLVRVAIVLDAEQITLSLHSDFKITALDSQEQLYTGQRLGKSQVLAVNTGIRINQLDFRHSGVRITPGGKSVIYINGAAFTGEIDITLAKNQRLLVVNRVELEEYVKGVLPAEVSAWWPMEALKAQAIVARTFALYQTRANAQKAYDLVATSFGQSYRGVFAQTSRTIKAARLSSGQVLSYQNKIFPAFYHSTCGGHTETAARLWKIDIVPLKGRECNFCRYSPHFRWKQKLSLAKISQALEAAGVRIATPEAIAAVDTDASGRITDLEITSDTGETKLSAHRFRLALGPSIIKSTNFTVELSGKTAYFQGYGWGHGVGMCQWGAFFMALKHFNAEQILGYYYPEAKIKTVDKIQNETGQIPTF